MSIVWNENLKTGVGIIDEQHQGMFARMSKIKELKAEKEGVYQLLVDLYDHCSMHFRTEESYMLEFDYPDYDIHKKCHDNALLNYKTYLDKGTDNHTMEEIATALVDYIECLFTDHYSNEDVKMADFLKETQFAAAE